MSAGKSVADILAGAKDTLKHADEFSKSVTDSQPSSITPKHEYSAAPYSMVKKSAPKDYSLADEAHSAGEGIKARIEMEKKVKQ